MSIREKHSALAGNAIVYTYPGGEVDIICAAERSFVPEGWEDSCGKAVEKSRREKGKKSEGEDRLRSMRRARANLRRLALANDFQWFVTLTLSPEKVDRYDARAIMGLVNRWLDNMVRRSGLRYILVPEQHKDGAYHFHGFFAGEGLEAIPSGHFDSAGHEYFNLPQWGFGFTTAVKLYGEYSAAVAYCCKYIGKQEGQRPMGRWYYSGGGLAQPEKTVATLDYRGLVAEYASAVEFDIPGSKMCIIHTKQED